MAVTSELGEGDSEAVVVASAFVGAERVNSHVNMIAG